MSDRRMSDVMDRRVVEMEFDNASFEKNVQKTMKSLDKLESSLQIDDANDGFESLARSIANCSSAIDQMADNFQKGMDSILKYQILGYSIESILRSIVSKIEGVIRQTIIEPITGGFKQYEAGIDMMAALLAGSREKYGLNEIGLTLEEEAKRTAKQTEDIESSLEGAAQYAADTSFGIKDMYNGITKMVQKGLFPDEALSMVKGLGNWSALLNSGVAGFGTLLYNIPQAMSIGSLLSMDYNSLANQNLFTPELEQVFKDIGEKMGTTGEADFSKGFKESLSDKWLTDEVLVEFAKIMGGYYTVEQLVSKGYSSNRAQQLVDLGNRAYDSASSIRTLTKALDSLQEAVTGGWVTSWQLVIGKIDDATNMFTNLTDIVSSFLEKRAKERNDALQLWHDDPNGRAKFMDGLKNLATTLDYIFRYASYGFRNFFPKDTGAKLISFSEKFFNLTERIKEFVFAGDKTTTMFGEVAKALGFGSTYIAQGIDETAESEKYLAKESEYNLATQSKFLDTVARIASGFSALRKMVRTVGKTAFNFARKIGNSLKPVLTIGSDIILFVSDALTTIAPLFDLIDLNSPKIDTFLKNVNTRLIKVSDTIRLKLNKALSYVTNFSDVVKKSGWKTALNMLWTDLKDFALEKASSIWNTITGYFGSKWEWFSGKLKSWLWQYTTFSKEGITDTGAINEDELINPEDKSLYEVGENVLQQLLLGIQSAIYENADSIQEAWDSFISTPIGESIDKALTNIRTFVSTKFSTIFETIKSLWNGGTYSEDYDGGDRTFVQIGFNIVRGLVEGIIEGGKWIWSEIRSVFQSVIDNVRGLFGVESPSKVFEEIGNFLIQGLGNGIKEGATWIWTKVLKPTFGWIKDRVVSLISGKFGMPVDEFESRILDPVVSFFKSIPEKLKHIFSSDFWSTPDYTKEMEDAAGRQIISGIEYALNSGMAFELLDDNVDNIKQFVQNVGQELYDYTKKSVGKNFLPELYEEQGEYVTEGFTEGIVEGPSLWDRVASFFSKFIEKIKEFYGIASPSKVMMTIGGFLIAGLIIGFTGEKGGLFEAVSGVFQDLKKLFYGEAEDTVENHTLLSKIIDGVKWLYDKVVTVISWVYTKVKNWISGIFTTIKDALLSEDLWEVVGKISEAFSNIMSPLTALRWGTGFANVGRGLKQFGKGFKILQKNSGILKKDTFGTTMLKVAGSILMIVAAIGILAAIPFKKAMSGMGVMTIMVAEIAALSIIIKKNQIYGYEFLGLSLGLLSFIGVLALLNTVNPGRAIMGSLAIVLLMNAFSKMAPSLAKKGEGSSLTILSMAGAVVALAASVAILGSLDVGNAIQGIAALALVMVEMRLLFWSQNKFDPKANALQMIGMASAVLILSGAVGLLGSMGTTTLIKGLAALAVVALITKMFSKLAASVTGTQLIKLIVIFGLLSVVMFSYNSFLSIIKGIGTTEAIEAAVSFGSILLAFAGSLALLGKIPERSFVKAILNLGLLLAALGGLGYLLEKTGGAQYITGIVAVVGDVLSTCLYYIGKAVSSVAAGFSSNLPQIGKDLSDFTTNVGDFATKIKSFDSKTLNGIKVLADVITTLFTQDIKDRVLGIFTSDSPIATFQQNICDIADAMLAFADHLNGNNKYNKKMESGDIKRAGEAADLASELAKVVGIIQGEGGWLQFVIGLSGSVSNFGTNVGYIADGLIAFNDKIGGAELKTSKMTSAIDVANALAALMNAVPKEDGFLQLIVGGSSFEHFGEDVANMAAGLKDFADAINNTEFPEIDANMTSENSNFARAILLAGDLNEFAKKLPNVGGLVQAIAGQKDLGEFGNSMEPFAKGLVAYSNAISGWGKGENGEVKMPNQTQLDQSNAAATNLAEFALTLSKAQFSVSSYDALNGIVELNAFSASIGPFGKALAAYSVAISSFASETNSEVPEGTTIKAANQTITALDSLAKTLLSSGYYKFANQVDPLKEFGKNFGSFGDGLKLYSTKVSGFAEVSDESDRKAASETFLAFAEFVATIESNDKYKQAETVIKALPTFATQWPGFADNLMLYSKKVKGFSTASNDKDRNAAKETFDDFAALITGLGLTGWKVFELNMEAFNKLSGSIGDYGTNFGIFADTMRTVYANYDNIKSGAEESKGLMESMNNWAKQFDNKDGFWTKLVNAITGENGGWDEVLAIAKDMSLFGGYIANFTRGVRGASGSAELMKSALEEVIAVTSLMSDNGDEFDTLYENMKAFDSYMTDFGFYFLEQGIESFYQDIHDFEYHDEVFPLLNSMSELYTAMVKLGSFDPQQFEATRELLRIMTSDVVNEINSEFVLRPVIDMTDFNSGVASMRNSLRFGGVGSLRPNTSISEARSISYSSTYDDSRVIAEIQNVEAKIGEIEGAITQMQLVLDTGAVAGSVAPKVDKLLRDRIERTFRGGTSFSGFIGGTRP